MSALTEIADAARTALERVGPSVVSIGRWGRGSGIVVAEGQVLTNAHNLRDRTTSVTFADGRSVQGSLLGADPDADLAVLEVDTAAVPPIVWGEGDVAIGTPVFALAGSTTGPRIGFGLVSSSGRSFRGPRGHRVPGGIEHTAGLGRGASGGPVVDAESRLIGINVHRLLGTYLALPATPELRERVTRLAAGEPVTRRRLGIAVAPADVATRLRRSVGLPEREGLLVRGVDDDSPADRAGIRIGDLIVRTGDRALARSDDLFAALDGVEGDHLELGIVRGAEELTVTVTFPSESSERSDAEGSEGEG